jgi:hypothetical protein
VISLKFAKCRFIYLLGCVSVLFLLLAASSILPTDAVAAECTDTWTGATEGAWQVAGNWSAGHVPTESDVACIGSGKTAKVSSGTNKVAVVQGEGSLAIEKSTLEVLSTTSESQVKVLTMDFNGILTGPGTLKVTKTLAWEFASTMKGTGKTVVGSGASAFINTGAGLAVLEGRTLLNEGTFTYNSEGVLRLRQGAKLENTGTFNENREGSSAFSSEDTVGVSVFVNKGTFQKTVEHRQGCDEL